MRKIALLLKHLQDHGSITPLEALKKYGYYRVSDGVWKLRNRGYNIVTVKEESSKGDEFARYVLIAEESAA